MRIRLWKRKRRGNTIVLLLPLAVIVALLVMVPGSICVAIPASCVLYAFAWGIASRDPEGAESKLARTLIYFATAIMMGGIGGLMWGVIIVMLGKHP